MAKSKSQATRGGGPRPLPFYVWLLTGVVLGLGLATLDIVKPARTLLGELMMYGRRGGSALLPHRQG